MFRLEHMLLSPPLLGFAGGKKMFPNSTQAQNNQFIVSSASHFGIGGWSGHPVSESNNSNPQHSRKPAEKFMLQMRLKFPSCIMLSGNPGLHLTTTSSSVWGDYLAIN